MALAHRHRPAFRAGAAARPVIAQRSRIALLRSAGQPTTAVTAGVVTDETFDELVLNSTVPVLVDFWAPWCGPCRMIDPLVDELATEFAGKVACVKLNTDASPETASRFGVRSVPTVMLFKGGQRLDTIVGAVPKATLAQAVEKYL